jgi:hypothetical protein
LQRGRSSQLRWRRRFAESEIGVAETERAWSREGEAQLRCSPEREDASCVVLLSSASFVYCLLIII